MCWHCFIVIALCRVGCSLFVNRENFSRRQMLYIYSTTLGHASAQRPQMPRVVITISLDFKKSMRHTMLLLNAPSIHKP